MTENTKLYCNQSYDLSSAINHRREKKYRRQQKKGGRVFSIFKYSHWPAHVYVERLIASWHIYSVRPNVGTVTAGDRFPRKDDLWQRHLNQWETVDLQIKRNDLRISFLNSMLISMSSGNLIFFLQNIPVFLT